ncbi:hypothetical protein [Liquorilactobacillus nagelii]|uniref:hypothetical protein n=1 Tax=Liquorilactobacillus nagelii TaxID=82688 RepID=UPI001CC942BC|nr:hypothetical protein [Liquorilactobacillus nagelii]ULQ49043.1 hypothetical protein J6864_08745 [Liquorilactobacillus nagelii]
MKTREELLKELDEPEIIASKSPFLDDWNTQRKIGIDGVKDILQAPTQEQLDCPYCYGMNLEDYHKRLNEDSSYIAQVKYCEVCGRKLGDE